MHVFGFKKKVCRFAGYRLMIHFLLIEVEENNDVQMDLAVLHKKHVTMK